MKTDKKERQSERTPREGAADGEQKKSVGGVAAPRLVVPSSFIGLMCDELGEFKVISVASIDSIEWDVRKAEYVDLLTRNRKFTLTSTSASELFSLLGLEDHPVIEAFREMEGEGLLGPSLDHSQRHDRPPSRDTETRNSEQAPPRTHPPECPPFFLWRLV